jgi:hypothetical protein
MRVSLGIAPFAQTSRRSGSPLYAWYSIRKQTAMLDSYTKLNIAVVRFAGFVAELPLSLEKDDVLEYHDILELFEQGCGLDLSQFRIAPDRLKPPCGWRLEEPSVEFGYFLSQLRALTDYLTTVLGGRPC